MSGRGAAAAGGSERVATHALHCRARLRDAAARAAAARQVDTGGGGRRHGAGGGTGQASSACSRRKRRRALTVALVRRDARARERQRARRRADGEPARAGRERVRAGGGRWRGSTWRWPRSSICARCAARARRRSTRCSTPRRAASCGASRRTGRRRTSSWCATSTARSCWRTLHNGFASDGLLHQTSSSRLFEHTLALIDVLRDAADKARASSSRDAAALELQLLRAARSPLMELVSMYASCGSFDAFYDERGAKRFPANGRMWQELLLSPRRARASARVSTRRRSMAICKRSTVRSTVSVCALLCAWLCLRLRLNIVSNCRFC